MRVLVLFSLIVLSVRAFAEPVAITWEHPVTRVDSTALAVTEIASTKLEWAREGQAFDNSIVVPAPATTTSLDINSGRWCFRAYTVDTDGLVSDPTTTLCVRVNSKPNAPTIISIGRGPAG